MRVRVAIDLALDRLFDYEVPEALEKKLAVGQLLSVPFGPREARGFAMEIGEGRETGDERQETPPRPLKPITAILDETPFFSPALLELVKILAAYTAAPLESVLKAAVPASVLKKNVRPRELMFVEPALAVQPVRLTKRQQWLYDQIVRLGGGWMAQLCEELKTTPATLKELGRLGLLAVAVRTRRRDPLAGRKILPTKPFALNAEQQAALEAIEGQETRDERQEGQETGDEKQGGQETGDRKREGRETRDEKHEGRETGDEKQEPDEDGRRETALVSDFSSHDLSSRVSSLASSPSPASRVSSLASPPSPDSRVSSLASSPSPAHSNIQTFQHSNISPIPPFQHSNISPIPPSKHSSIPPSKHSPIPPSKHSNIHPSKHSNIPPFQHSNIPTFPHSPIPPSKHSNIHPSKHSNIPPFKHSNISQPLLLHGVTGSGKTEVYLQAIARELAAGRGAIVLVPEIALTPQTVARFAGRFGNQVAVLHSALSDGERYDEWHRIRSGSARVVVGPRSAVFAPVRNLGLIVVDEEHETSYKQEECPRYHARDAAVLRGAIEGARVVLGSATPSLETWLNVQRGKYALATMAHRAGAGTVPNVLVVDMNETLSSDAASRRVPRNSASGDAAACRVMTGSGRGAIFSTQLLDAIGRRLDRHEQTILFLNRRGYSRSVVCEACGHVMTCDACDLPYTYHRVDACLRCHVCGGWRLLPKACPACGATALSYKGIGTQRAEAALKACFPRAAVLRMDADSTARKNSHDDILSSFRRGEADILLGTQMIAKGLDFPNVTLVGVLNADSSLMMPDFRASERTYQLLAQVAGRAGRAELPGEVIVQTWDPSAFAIRAAARGDFAAFAARELKDRAEGWFPPYCHLATVNFRSRDLRLVAAWAEMYAKSLKGFATARASRKGRTDSERLLVGEAVPSALEKADGQFRWQIVMRAARPSVLVSAWRWMVSVRPPPKNLKVAVDIDAFNLV